MQVSRWVNSLAIRLPKKLAEHLKLKDGDEIGLVPLGEHRFAVEKRDQTAAFLEGLQKLSFHLPPGYRFCRDEAKER